MTNNKFGFPASVRPPSPGILLRRKENSGPRLSRKGKTMWRTSWASAAMDTESLWFISTADVDLPTIAHIKSSEDLLVRAVRWEQSLEKWSSQGDSAPKGNTQCT